MSGCSILEVKKRNKMINPDFHMTLYISEEVLRMVCMTVGFVFACWGIVKMTDILFGKRNERKNSDAS